MRGDSGPSLTWDDSLKGPVGGRTPDALAKAFDIQTVGDLLTHYPRRYLTRGELTDLATLRPDDYVTVLARIKSITPHSYLDRRRNRRAVRTELVVTDGTGDLLLTFFQARGLNRLRAGQLGLFSGQVGTFRGKPQLVHPEYELLDPFTDEAAGEARADQFAASLIPVYPATAKVPSPAIAKAVHMLLPQVAPLADPLPADIRARLGLVDRDTAVRTIHEPDSREAASAARRRLAFDEAFLLQTVLAQRRHHAEHMGAAARPVVPGGLRDAFDEQSHLVLTAGQVSVGTRIEAGLAGSRPMHLLLQGDVGTGKTLVALRAMLQVVDAGAQAVLLAPTEVLAQQHYTAITRLLGPLAEGGLLGGAEQGTRVALLTGSQSAATRKRTLLDIVTGEAGIVVGTHALLSDTVHYQDLGLIVVDEQHRFGVEQRSALLERIPGQRPHLLVMTATPIPRTVAMTVFGDLDVVTLTGRPSGDPQISTHVVSESAQPTHVERAWRRIAEEVADGRQVFIVCPRISAADDELNEPTDADGDTPALTTTHAVEDMAADLSAGALRDERVGVLHGRMSAEEKDDVMGRFARGPRAADGLDVMVSTTVIEVGVDIPSAGVMVIMDADRFGISQLHQLRGRVGRDGRPALCLLVTQASPGQPAYERLQRVAGTLDGAELARLDLEVRREGDVLGASQSGYRSSLRLLSVLADEDLISAARDAATEVVGADPDLTDHPELADAVAELERRVAAEYLDKT